jgi:hypothetical protein
MNFTARINDETYSDPTLFEAAAGFWRSTAVHQPVGKYSVTSKPVKPRTISNGRTITVPRHWKAMSKAQQRGPVCSKLDAVEEEWLGVWVRFGDDNIGQVWSIAYWGKYDRQVAVAVTSHVPGAPNWLTTVDVKSLTVIAPRCEQPALV